MLTVTSCTVRVCCTQRRACLTIALAAAANLRTRFLPKPRSLAAVIADDERLAGLSEAKILAEVRTQVRACDTAGTGYGRLTD
jgi:hypothetical protein